MRLQNQKAMLEHSGDCGKMGETDAQRELRRRMVDALWAGERDLAWNLLREYFSLPPEREKTNGLRTKDQAT